MVSVINRETFFECDSWEHAQKNSCGYDNSELLAFYENINSNSQRPSSSHLLEPRLIELFCAIQRAAKNLGTVSIADVGGANGYLGKHALDFFDLNLKWTVFEKEVFVDLYKKIHNSKLEFETIDQFKINLAFSISLFHVRYNISSIVMNYLQLHFRTVLSLFYLEFQYWITKMISNDPESYTR